jgi:RNA polymerase-binding transcription factor DksA
VGELVDGLANAGVDLVKSFGGSLAQVRAETVRRIDAALVRLEAGTYGSCVECATAISEPRLRALPFAARCQACEEQREEKHGQARRVEQRRGNPSLFSDVVTS